MPHTCTYIHMLISHMQWRSALLVSFCKQTVVLCCTDGCSHFDVIHCCTLHELSYICEHFLMLSDTIDVFFAAKVLYHHAFRSSHCIQRPEYITAPSSPQQRTNIIPCCSTHCQLSHFCITWIQHVYWYLITNHHLCYIYTNLAPLSWSLH